MGTRSGQGDSWQLASILCSGHCWLHQTEVPAAWPRTVDEVKRRDLRLELERAEKRARAPEAATEEQAATREEDEQAAKRRKLIADAAALDKDDSDDEEGSATKTNGLAIDGADDVDVDDEDDEDDDDEDETAELLRELEKIKRERAEEKARQVRAVPPMNVQSELTRFLIGSGKGSGR